MATAFWTRLLDACAPALCVLCRGPPGPLPWVCAACAERLVLFRGPVCLRCGAARPLPAPVCARCPEWPARFVAARAAAPDAGVAKALVRALRAGRLAAAPPLGALAVAAVRGMRLPGRDRSLWVVPVPRSVRSWRARAEVDPDAEIARVVARALRRPLRRRVLWRVRPEPDASRTEAGRRREVRGAFRAAPDVRGRRVLLVADRTEAGATFGACARALGRRGAAEVWAVSVTRAR